MFIEDVAERVVDKSYFTVAGGEPFMYPHLGCLVKKLADTIPGSCTQLRLLTNGSLLPTAARPLYDIKGKLDLQYVVSLHMEFMDLEEFLSNIRDFPCRDDALCKTLMAPGTLEAAKKHIDGTSLTCCPRAVLPAAPRCGTSGDPWSAAGIRAARRRIRKIFTYNFHLFFNKLFQPASSWTA